MELSSLQLARHSAIQQEQCGDEVDKLRKLITMSIGIYEKSMGNMIKWSKIDGKRVWEKEIVLM